MAATSVSGLREVFATVRRTNAAHVSALDALERAFVAETALFGCVKISHTHKHTHTHTHTIKHGAKIRIYSIIPRGYAWASRG